MKLRTGKPIWLSRRPVALRNQRLSSDMACDVAIIGAGITGALVAHELLKAGLRVVMVDKRQAGFGSTAASTGLLMIQTDTSIADLTRLHNRRTAERTYELGYEAIRQIGVMVRRLRINCGWKAARTLYVASATRDTAYLREEADRTEKIGFEIKRVLADELQSRYGLTFPSALLAAGAAQVNALALTRGLLRAAQKNPCFRQGKGHTHDGSGI
jgi:glycine/D-amino acid oxidase-like deaminating enzyme